MQALAGAKLLSEAGVVLHREYSMIKYVPELSIQPITP